MSRSRKATASVMLDSDQMVLLRAAIDAWLNEPGHDPKSDEWRSMVNARNEIDAAETRLASARRVSP